MADEHTEVELGEHHVCEVDPLVQYFCGDEHLLVRTADGISAFTLTFAPGCRNDWHVHRASEGGGQMLICLQGNGWYQEWAQPARELHVNDVVTVPAGVKHWHGAQADSWFRLFVLEMEGTDTCNIWFEPVSDEEYCAL